MPFCFYCVSVPRRHSSFNFERARPTSGLGSDPVVAFSGSVASARLPSCSAGLNELAALIQTAFFITFFDKCRFVDRFFPPYLFLYIYIFFNVLAPIYACLRDALLLFLLQLPLHRSVLRTVFSRIPTLFSHCKRWYSLIHVLYISFFSQGIL